MKIRPKTAIVLICLSPLLFLGTWSRHDWGDDFAQYLIQSRNIVENKSQTDNGLVFPESGDHYAVTAYPVGFPLLLAPVYVFFGLDMMPYFLLLSVLLISSGLLLFNYFNQHRPAFLSLIIVLAFCFNRYVLEWKWQILSDIPFLLGVVMTWVCWKPEKKSWKIALTWGLFCAFLSSVRIVGVTIPVAMVLTIFLKRAQPFASGLKESVLLMASTIVCFLVLNAFLFDVPVGNFAGFYSNALQRNTTALVNNIELYSDLAGVFLPLPFGSKPVPSWWILFALGIWFLRLIRRKELPEIFLGVYGSVLLFYPYQDGGFRFLLPVLPLLVSYMSDLILLITPYSWSLKRKYLTASIFILLLFSGNPEFLIRVAERPSSVIQGPQDPNGQGLIAEIRENIPDTSLVAFNKPRALALFTGNKTTNMLKSAALEITHGQFNQMDVDYLVLSKAKDGEETSAPEFNLYAASYVQEFDTAWSNDGFILLKRKPDSGSGE